MATGGLLFGSGFLLTAAGVQAHSLPLVYTGNYHESPEVSWGSLEGGLGGHLESIGSPGVT